MHIRINDIVEVIAGDDIGKRGKVLSVNRETGKVTVQGINLVYRHMKPSRNSPQGGRLSKEMPLQASNVQLIDPSTNQPTRVGTRYNSDGSKELFAKKSGAMIRVLAKANPKYAKKK
ncbi:MAG TPA: 50S ribosomal protein L24 [Gemmataceae bacterium]|jgi:large subunit ribosomal protein L24|nr:50S ribosomal protein L24 [Gemmataceae bacterium]